MRRGEILQRCLYERGGGMSDMKLTNEKILAFDGHEKISALKAPTKLTEFGQRQNEVNELLAVNINDLIKRVCALEDGQLRHEEVMRKIAAELKEFKKELDRVRLSEKLNSGTIERLSRAIDLADGREK